MSYYGVEPWQNQPRQASWEHLPPSRSGASSSAGGRGEDGPAFLSQIEEVDRAIENLARSGKLFPGTPGSAQSPFRRDPSMMGGGGSVGGPSPGPQRPAMQDFGSGPSGGPHIRGGSGGHFPVDFDPNRQHSSSNVQGFYVNQRYGPLRKNTDVGGDPQQHARRFAAQRERELRNYHQEQQYNRGKPERSMSPNMSEDERRELIQRQHRALYGDDGLPINPSAQESSVSGRGPSPMAYPPYLPQDQSKAQPPSANQNDHGQAGPSPQPVGHGNTPPMQPPPPPHQQQTSRTSTSSPKQTGQIQNHQGQVHNQDRVQPEPTQRTHHAKTMSSSVAPIGTRPSAASISQGATKRATPPAASPLNFPGSAGGGGVGVGGSSSNNERAGSSASNKDAAGGGAGRPSADWGSGSGVWGKNPLGVQASVWG